MTTHMDAAPWQPYLESSGWADMLLAGNIGTLVPRLLCCVIDMALEAAEYRPFKKKRKKIYKLLSSACN
jgi:hypothetical protein